MKRALTLAVALVFLGGTAHAQDTPDGTIPANKGVCDELIGFTQGFLYGLCVEFCEAQDCEAAFDPLKNELTFGPGCSPSDPNVLENYNRRRNSGAPPMPCVNIVERACPCWTEDELDSVADGDTVFCGQVNHSDSSANYLFGHDAQPDYSEAAHTSSVWGDHAYATCYFEEWSTPTIRYQYISPAQRLHCRASLLAECANRGF
jgi:hypothetical protein